jgi:DNA adenine methylase
MKAKPFLKWAGGKRSLLPEIRNRLPEGIASGRIRCYVEPFLGGGSVFFDLSQRFAFLSVCLSDSNEHLMAAYKAICYDVESVIGKLSILDYQYRRASTMVEKRMLYYKVRNEFNRVSSLDKTAELIFLNKTCFNGLYRVNSKGEFNTPFGYYSDPFICDVVNLRAVSALLKPVWLEVADFTEAIFSFPPDRYFFYFDPPYRPLPSKDGFCQYTYGGFTDADQETLSMVFRRLDRTGAFLMLSNSDTGDGFFEDLYAGYRIERVRTRSTISCRGETRGVRNEILIMNY